MADTQYNGFEYTTYTLPRIDGSFSASVVYRKLDGVKQHGR